MTQQVGCDPQIENHCSRVKIHEKGEKEGDRERGVDWLTLLHENALAAFKIRILPLGDILHSDSAMCQKLSVHFYATVSSCYCYCDRSVRPSVMHTRPHQFSFFVTQMGSKPEPMAASLKSLSEQLKMIFTWCGTALFWLSLTFSVVQFW